MIDGLDKIPHHPAIEEIVEVLCNRTQNTDRGFFRVTVAYFLGKMAAAQQATVFMKNHGEIPVNLYALALATSGFGKGHSVNILEGEFLAPFRKVFLEDTMPSVTEKSLWDYANAKAAKNSTDQQDEYDKAVKVLNSIGAYPFTFDSGTGPAVKQLRDQLILRRIGSVNLQIDEIGSNLVSNEEILNVFLELYDQGLTKIKLTKNTAENKRVEELVGKTPTNMLLFGTDSKLLDGGVTENAFYSFLETGYARRCIFAQGHQDRKAFHTMTAEEIYLRQIEPTNTAMIDKWADHFAKLAEPSMYKWAMQVPDDVAIQLVEYKIACEKAADQMKEHEQIRKAEMSHRYFKALKLAGTLAFIEQSVEVEMSHLMHAIKLVEESGTAFQSILTRPKPHERLAKFIADVGQEVTHADLLDALPFYKAGVAARNDMMTLAIAWGYPRHIIIKKRFADGIEFFSGTTLQQTNLEELSLSVSPHWTNNYEPATLAFDQLEQLAVLDDGAGGPMHWNVHTFHKGYRADESCIPGFNMIALDVDGTTSLDLVHSFLADYKFMTYTTKRHGVDGKDRFRLIIPCNYYLELDQEEYREFMNAVMEWLPFKTDEGANQRARKWMTNPKAICHTNADGQVLDVLPFIPRTTRNEQYKKELQQVQSMDNLERWFAQRIATGNRNDNMIKFALALVDSGMSLQDVNTSVYAFNRKLNNPLPDQEIASTVMKTVAKRYIP